MSGIEFSDIGWGIGILGVAVLAFFLIRAGVRSVREQGADDQRAKHAIDAHRERIEAEKKMAAAREKFAKDGGADAAAKEGRF